jgi:NAD(P)-dependent dehydrogenase (short-subunit alcohol dehydrogenase family)
MNIENKTVLVTGSTDGVGRLVARRLADQGARVLIHGRDRTRSEQLLNEIRAANRGSAAFLPADFSSLAEVRRLPTLSARNVTDSTFSSTMLASARAALPVNERPARTATSCALPSTTSPDSYSPGFCCPS